MSRIDYYDDPEAPDANSLVVAASAVVPDDAGRILLQRRTDNSLWALPGGGLELGESVAAGVAREVREETGSIVEPEYIIGVYSDPRHVLAYSDGEVRQEFSICIACSVIGGRLSVSEESTDVRFFEAGEIPHLDMHPRIRLRVTDFLDGSKAMLR
jgi:ADP-ribose pyrophosphatase YjhB (NUDIX family)